MLADKHIIFDLDHTLIYSPEEPHDWLEKMIEENKDSKSFMKSIGSRVGKIVVPHRTRDAKSFKGISGSSEISFIIRPGCISLLAFCFVNFKTVSVWSAGTREYVLEIVDNLFRRVGKYPNIVWTRDELVDGIKPLSAMMKIYGDRTGMNMHNTLLVDDMDYNFEMNRFNGVLIPHYEPSPTIEGINSQDTSLLELKKWFESKTFRESNDVQTLRKDVIFTL